MLDRPTLDKLSFLADVAEAVLVEGLTQQQAAERFDLSRPSISRLLSEARDAGLVIVEVRRVVQESDDLALRLTEKFEMRAVNVSSLSARAENGDRAFVTFASNKVLDRLKPDCMLGLTLGKTIGNVIHEMALSEPRQISVVQLCGSLGHGNALLDSHALTSALARSFGATCIHMHAPYAVETRKLRDALNENPANRLCLEQGRNCNVALVGIGELDDPSSSLVTGGHVSMEAAQYFKNAKAIGDVGGYYISADGSTVTAPESGFWRTGIDCKDFKKIETRIGVAIGSRKAVAIQAAMRGNWITHLVTDHETALALLQ